MQMYQADINLTKSYLERWGMTNEEFWRKLKIAETNKRDPEVLLRLFGIDVTKESVEFMNAFIGNKEIANTYKAAGLALHAYYDCFHIHENLHKVMDLVAAYFMAMAEGKFKSKNRPGFTKIRKYLIKFVEDVE